MRTGRTLGDIYEIEAWGQVCGQPAVAEEECRLDCEEWMHLWVFEVESQVHDDRESAGEKRHGVPRH